MIKILEYTFFFLGGVVSIISLYNFFFKTSEKALFEQIKYRIGLGTKGDERKVKILLKDYKFNKHLTHNPHQRSSTIIMECFRFLYISPIFIAIMCYYFYIILVELALNNEKIFSFHIYLYVSLMMTLILIMVLIKMIFKRLSPAYHFRIVHEFTVCQLYELLKKIKSPNSFYAIEEVKKIVTTVLEREFPKNELTDLGFAFFLKIYNYPKAMKKKMKKRNYNFKSDKIALMKLLDMIPDEPIKTFQYSNSHYTVNTTYQFHNHVHTK